MGKNMAKETAEQKLLRLIEQGGGGQTPAAPAPQPHAAPAAQQTLQAVQAVGGSFALPDVFSKINAVLKAVVPSAPRGGFGVREINKILALAVVSMAVFFTLNMTRGLRDARQTVSFKEPRPVKVSPENILPQFPDLQRYVQAVSPRNIFNPFEKKAVEPAAVTASVPAAVPSAARLLEKAGALKLVGVSWLDSPDSASAMIENVTSGVTYFLRSGEMIDGMVVKSIYADSIVLEMDGERMELKL